MAFTPSRLLVASMPVLLTLPCRAQATAPQSSAPVVSPVTTSAQEAVKAPVAPPTQEAKQAPAPTTETLLRGYIDPQVPKPKDMFYRGPGQGAGSLFGAVGAAATAGADNGPKGQLLGLMDKEHIDISAILLDETQAKLSASPELEKRIKAIQGANLHVAILMYGLVKTQIFSSTMYPTIKVLMILNKEGEKTPIWTESEWVATAASENDKGFSFDTFMKEPDKIKIVWANVSKIAVSRLFDSMQNKLPK